jgi:hypothetical protein
MRADRTDRLPANPSGVAGWIDLLNPGDVRRQLLQQTVDALKKERDALRDENERLRKPLENIAANNHAQSWLGRIARQALRGEGSHD